MAEETPEQPDDVEAEEPEELSIAQQLDILLEKIEQQEPGFIATATDQAAAQKLVEAQAQIDAEKAAQEPGVEPVVAVSATEPVADADNPLDELIDQQVDQAIAEAEQQVEQIKEAEPAAATVDAGDDLGDQIQALLDSAAASSSVADDSSTEAPQADESAVAEQPDIAEPTDETEPAETPQVVARESSPPTAEEADETPSEQMTALDEALAEAADEAVAGDFETIEQVSASEAAPEGEAEIEFSEVELPDASFDPPDSAEPAPQEAESAVVVESTASDVADELDSQPERSTSSSQPPVIQAAPLEPAGRIERLTAMLPSGKAIERIAFRACVLCSKPIHRLNLQRRNTIGYVGLLTLFNALAMILYGLIF